MIGITLPPTPIPPTPPNPQTIQGPYMTSMLMTSPLPLLSSILVLFHYLQSETLLFSTDRICLDSPSWCQFLCSPFIFALPVFPLKLFFFLKESLLIINAQFWWSENLFILERCLGSLPNSRLAVNFSWPIDWLPLWFWES